MRLAGDDGGALAQMRYVDQRFSGQWSRSSGLDLRVVTQISYGANADFIPQPADVPRRDILQIVGPNQPMSFDYATVRRRQSANVPDVRRSVKGDPVRVCCRIKHCDQALSALDR